MHNLGLYVVFGGCLFWLLVVCLVMRRSLPSGVFLREYFFRCIISRGVGNVPLFCFGVLSFCAYVGSGREWGLQVHGLGVLLMCVVDVRLIHFFTMVGSPWSFLVC